MDTSKKIRKMVSLIVFALLIGLAAMVLRGPHISNSLKRIILPELEMATGQKVIAQKIYINIYPFFVEIKELKMFDDKGDRILFAGRVKGYLDITGILDKNIRIRRLVIRDAELTLDRQQSVAIMSNIKTYLLQKNENKIDVQVMSVEVQKGKGEFTDAEIKTRIALYDFDGEILIGKTQNIKASAGKITVKKEGWPEISTEVSSVLQMKDGKLLINKFQINSFGSQLTGSGEYIADKLDVKTGIKLFVKTLKEMFNLSRAGDGWLDAKGDITYRDKKIFVDLKVIGKFYLQTLMELLEVKEKIEGLVDIKGEIKGQVNNIKGSGTAILQKGNIYDVEIDYLKSTVSYSDGTMKFTDGQGKLYNGSAKASASILLPVVDSFELDVNFSNVDSSPIFKLIGWDPGIQAGKVTGTLYSSGHEFNPSGSFQFQSIRQGDDVLGRIKLIDGAYSMTGQMLTLTDIKLGTGKTDISAKGLVDVEKKTLNIDCVLKSVDVTDIASPYYKKLLGKGKFDGKVTGIFDDPVISGMVKIDDAVIEGYPAGTLSADLFYRKNLLRINEMALTRRDELHRISGEINFKNAKTLFDLAGAEFKLRAALKNAEAERFAKIFYPDFQATGKFSSDFTVSGTPERFVIKGPTTFSNASLYDVPFDSASFDLDYNNKRLMLLNVHVKKGGSRLQGDFTLYPNAAFSYKAYSDNVLISHLIRRPLEGEVAFSIKSEGSGTFDNPTILIDAKMKEGVLKGKNIGSGVITASIKNKHIALNAKMINEKISISARGRLEEELPWDATVDIQTGRYDFLITSFLKDVPDDLILNLNAYVTMRGTKKHISASSKIRHMVLSMYGYSFSNEEEIAIELRDRKISLNTFSLRSGNTLLRAGGDMVIGKGYNLSFEGSSVLSPFKSLSSKLGLLKGNAEFVVEVTGDWETPRIYGGITLEDGAIGLKDYPHRISALNGSLYIDNDRVVLQKLSGKIGGGDIDISGILYLKKFSFKRFYVEAKLTDIITSLSKDFSVKFGGDILYKGTPASQIISGDILISNVRYRERVEWKSWLLKARTSEKIKSEISDLEKAELNIKITGKDNIYIDNNIARATVSADMILRGTLYRPVLFGRLESKEGTVYFRNNQFRILNASADFADPNRINPFIDIASETTVKNYKIKMNLEGQLDHFNMSLSSDPPLKEMDIFALLTVGQIGGELKGIEGGIGAGEATSFVTGKLQDVIEERLKTITGLDRFQVDPYVSKFTGTVEPRVTASKRLLGDKIFVTYTSSVGSVEEQIIKIEYFAGKNISLIGVRDERGILGSDIRFRFEFK